MFERTDDQVRRVFIDAHSWAHAADHGRLGTEHLLVGLLHGEGGDLPTSHPLTDAGVRAEAVERRAVDLSPNGGPAPEAGLPFTPRAKHVVAQSAALADDLLQVVITPTHLLLALLDESGCTAVAILRSLDVDTEALADQLRDALHD